MRAVTIVMGHTVVLIPEIPTEDLPTLEQAIATNTPLAVSVVADPARRVWEDNPRLNGTFRISRADPETYMLTAVGLLHRSVR